MIVGGIFLAGIVGLCFSWYRQTQDKLDTTLRTGEDNRRAGLEKALSPNKPKPRTPAAPKVALTAENPMQQGRAGGTTAHPLGALPPQPEKKLQQHLLVTQGPPVTSGGFAPIPKAGMTISPMSPQSGQQSAKAAERDAERKANNLLEQARKTEKVGHLQTAADLYQQILNRFPDTEIAKVVEKTVDLDVLNAKAQIARAQQLEKGGKLADAKEVYEKLINLYPKTEQAKSAKERLEKLGKSTGR
jgi:TolA-binding protein